MPVNKKSSERFKGGYQQIRTERCAIQDSEWTWFHPQYRKFAYPQTVTPAHILEGKVDLRKSWYVLLWPSKTR